MYFLSNHQKVQFMKYPLRILIKKLFLLNDILVYFNFFFIKKNRFIQINLSCSEFRFGQLRKFMLFFIFLLQMLFTFLTFYLAFASYAMFELFFFRFVFL